ncbi:hypothetical protein COY26_02625 [Candidatus Woesearchaeota archaeon CG_4_10_14_0_2_um_filter_33_10]|nr:MAG: hypothetical protein AUJ83_00355 [Candidatus Woesearchaeota archaeon CG1_02_33_12]PIN78530.1 MAG: hypothetical protein COV14_03215 [Candidatus Woesearchaeota archaeon CG10_big_fil_rev_8_21_14_0_10_33_12]PIU73081.1 MAG: hypothetical protein COS79_00205 [Candidatus Woesearchaeota archaeon CG06_land_8_20_14_3_00_33_13]PIZ53196.1 MAG: hypothetical protein COY26_02625 [Candidatus Woesearchaeota archaeon CG_4_10_14_0_2_um_filter_33_10]
MINELGYLGLGTSNKRNETRWDHLQLRKLMNEKWESIREFYKKSPKEINDFQFKRIKELVKHAYETVDLYKEKYTKEGFEPEDFKTWKDFQKLPILTKEELIEGFPEKTISKDYGTEFTTRSSGSSGKFVTLAVSPKAVYIDTIQGARQFYFQSGEEYDSTDLALFIYTSPWWVSSIDSEYHSEFLPTTTHVEGAIKTIKDLRPKVLSTYPTYLKELMSAGADLKGSGVNLVVIHSEQSTEKERKELSDFFKVKVLDEFSSEELTRIALECPYRKYHIEEDSCYIEVVDPQTKKVLDNNRRGLIIGTNLLNEATPIIRYSQGDIGTIKQVNNCICGSNFRLIESPQGRYMDSITVGNKVIPASCFMDLAYNWYLELDVPIHGLKYQIVQNRKGNIDTFLVQGKFGLSPSQKRRIQESFYQLVPKSIQVKVHIVNETPVKTGIKYRPIISLINKNCESVK